MTRLIAAFLVLVATVTVATAQAIGVAPVSPPVQGGGLVEIGQAFGPFLQPYVDAIAQTLIVSAIGWVTWLLKTKLNISIDQGHSDALAKFVQGRANSLIADGFVKMNGLTVNVDNAAVANEANLALTMIPDAVAHFGVTPDQLAAKIKDAIPQVPAGAAIVASAHAAQAATPAA